MGVHEAVRLAAVREAVAGRISTKEGVRRTGLSRRQFLRYKRRYRQGGPTELLHGNRGRPSPRRLGERERHRVTELLEAEVVLNDCHIRDLMAEQGLAVSADTVRRIRLALGRPPKQRRRPRQYRRRREREAQAGAMVLIDGSPFRWLGPDPPEFTLVGAMDDASGAVLSLRLRPEEDLHGFTEVLREVVLKHGVPWTLYGDRTAIAVRNDRHWTLEEELAGRQRPSHFGQMLEELGIRYIAALSPQAKGRIERLWRTLQDRLTAELALAGVDGVARAQAFLPSFIARFNAGFARPARELTPAWRRPPRQLEPVFACRYPRVVRRDHTVSIPGAVVHIPPGVHRRSYADCRVEVRELLDGRLLVLYQGKLISTQPAPSGTFTLVPRASATPERRPHRNRDLRRSHPVPPPSPPPPSPNPVQLAERRRPKTHHPWKRTYKTQPRRMARTGS